MKPALAALYRRAPMGMRLGLEPMREACARAGNPERALRAAHVAGTNGKGSVCAMLESIARASGLHVGLYTSPHLCRFVERVRVGGRAIDEDDLERHLARALELGPELSFFEAATLAALLALAEARVDLAILEVGLGGRLDATNVIPTPAAAAITRIALDHTELLGDTVDAIAREKAGIAKPGLEIVYGAREGFEAARDECARRGATLVMAPEDPLLARATIGLAGPHQRDNARVAVALARKLGLGDDAILRGLATVEWPGRMETIVAPEGPVLLDGAHNPDGARALASAQGEPYVLLFGALADKDWPQMLSAFAPLARVYVPVKGRATADPRAMASLFPGEIAEDVRAGHALARARAGRARVVACGSLYLIGELRAALLGLPRDPPVAL